MTHALLDNDEDKEVEREDIESEDIDAPKCTYDQMREEMSI